MSLATTSREGMSSQKKPSNMLDTMKEEGTMTIMMMLWVHANWLNWYLYMPRFRLSTKDTKPGRSRQNEGEQTE